MFRFRTTEEIRTVLDARWYDFFKNNASVSPGIANPGYCKIIDIFGEMLEEILDGGGHHRQEVWKIVDLHEQFILSNVEIQEDIDTLLKHKTLSVRALVHLVPLYDLGAIDLTRYSTNTIAKFHRIGLVLHPDNLRSLSTTQMIDIVKMNHEVAYDWLPVYFEEVGFTFDKLRPFLELGCDIDIICPVTFDDLSNLLPDNLLSLEKLAKCYVNGYCNFGEEDYKALIGGINLINIINGKE